MEKNLSKAMAAAQGEVKNALTDSKNPHYKSTYASLEAVLDVLRPVWTKHGLAVTQSVQRSEFGINLITEIVHGESGEYCLLAYPIISMKQDLHGMGAAFTYSRRQALKGAFGIAEEDDDGNKATTKQPERTQEPMKNHATPQPKGAITEAQWKRAIAISIKAWGEGAQGDLIRVVRQGYGVEPRALDFHSYNELCNAIEAGSSADAIIKAKTGI